MIHPTAIISTDAKIGERVEIGPYSVVEGDAEINDDCVLGPRVLISDGSRIGKNCQIYQGAAIGGVPQDKKFKGERTVTLVGENNVIREYVTVNRGTTGGGGKTVIGNNNLIMCYVHIAHDCIIHDEVTVGAYTGLGGHVTVENKASFSGMVGIHHFCRIGEMAYVGGMSKVTQDVPPFIMADGNPCRFRGLNLVGLRRNIVSAGAIAALKETYRVLFLFKEGNLLETIEKFKRSEEYSFSEVQKLVDFIEERSKNAQGRFLENSRVDV